jgi:hypothetical protein
MGKSIRSKAKRTFRAKKRTDGVFAATEAARLARLHSKLAAIARADKEGDERMGDAEDAAQKEAEEDGGLGEGWCQFDFALLGLVDQADLTPELLGAMESGFESYACVGRHDGAGGRRTHGDLHWACLRPSGRRSQC